MEKDLYFKIGEASDFIKSKIRSDISYALVLGTGLQSFTEFLKNPVEIPYTDIPHFPKGNIQGHKGNIIFGNIGNIPLLVLSGRSHYYEGFSAKEVSFPVNVLAGIGVKHVFLTNAAGGVNPHYVEGDIVMIEDHINLIPDNPLRGKNDDRLGLRFPDMMYSYCPDTIEIISKIAESKNIPLKKGVYLAMSGPSLETPAEYTMAYRMGADLVGMSTVPEVITARHQGLKVSAFSIVSNVCYPKQRLTPTTIENVLKTVGESSEKLNTLLSLYFSSL